MFQVYLGDVEFAHKSLWVRRVRKWDLSALSDDPWAGAALSLPAGGTVRRYYKHGLSHGVLSVLGVLTTEPQETTKQSAQLLNRSQD